MTAKFWKLSYKFYLFFGLSLKGKNTLRLLENMMFRIFLCEVSIEKVTKYKEPHIFTSQVVG
jgi:hypothetical protein